MSPTVLEGAAAIAVVAVGGALGGVARYWLSGVVDRRGDGAFPWGTLVVNVSGALALGFLAGVFLIAPDGTVPSGRLGHLWAFLAVGVLGSYTTVSSFSLQTLALARGGELGRAGLNVLLSFVLCLAGAGVGLLLGRVLVGG